MIGFWSEPTPSCVCFGNISVDAFKSKVNKSLSKIGTKISDEALMKCYQTRKYGIENKLAKKVCKLSLDGELIQIYDTITIAAKENNTHNSSITNCCLGNKLTSGGFKWKYFDDDKTKENLLFP